MANILRLMFSLALAALVAADMARAEIPYPERLVKIVVPYPAGGGVDSLARAFADRLSRMWGQAVIIENKPGASTMIGGESVVRSAADGYTLLLTSDSSITSNPFLFKKLLFDPVAELAPVTQLVDLNQILVVHPSVQASTLAQLVGLAKKNPEKYNYGSYGKGSQPNLFFEALRAKTGAHITHIPFRGVAPAIVATLSNEVQMTLGGVSTTAEYIHAGKMKAVVIGGKARLPALPDIPTLAELGLGEAEPRSWYGLFAPPGTPAAVIAKLQRDFSAVMAEPDFKQRYIDAAGYTIVASTPAAFTDFIRADLEYKKILIETAGIEPE